MKLIKHFEYIVNMKFLLVENDIGINMLCVINPYMQLQFFYNN
jgi:hypothetical protein